MEKKQTLAAKLALIGAEAGNITKAKQGSVNYAYRSYDDVLGALRPLLAKYGVAFIPSKTDAKVTRFPSPNQHNPHRQGVQAVVTIEYQITDGEQSLTSAFCGMSVDYGDKAVTQASTMAHKYLLIQLFGLAGMLQDPDATNTEVSEAPAPAPKVQTPPKLETIPEASFNFELLEKMKWDGKYLSKGKDVIALTGKGGKKRVKITDAQKAVCELFLNRKSVTA